MKKTIGIIGGMGPLAACDLAQKIIKYTDASKDQEHIHVILDNDTNIPDRTAAILGEGPDPTREIITCGKRLIAMGADVLVMHCNTAHYFYDRVSEALSVPLLHIPMETAIFLEKEGLSKVGVLGTTGTRTAGVYTQALERHGMTAIYPAESDQELLMTAIYGHVKGGRAEALDVEGLVGMLSEMRGRGAQAFIMACTEMPMVIEALGRYESKTEFDSETEFADPAVIVAKRLVETAGYKVRSV